MSDLRLTVPKPLGQDARVSERSSSTAWKTALRRTPGGAVAVKSIVFVSGLLFILLGLALAALPGPLTIPPILVGLYIWSTEFAWADRLLERAKRSAREAWENARRRPVITGLVTVSGLVAFGVGVWLVGKYDLVDRAKELVGLG
jgi:hypothetical protein